MTNRNIKNIDTLMNAYYDLNEGSLDTGVAGAALLHSLFRSRKAR